MDSIAFPVTFDETGFKKVYENTYEYFQQMLTVALLTEPGVQPITPDFGVADPSFTGIDTGLFILNAAKFVPEIQIQSLEKSINPVTHATTVAFKFEIIE